MFYSRYSVDFNSANEFFKIIVDTIIISSTQILLSYPPFIIPSQLMWIVDTIIPLSPPFKIIVDTPLYYPLSPPCRRG